MASNDQTSWTLIRRAASGSGTDGDAFARRYGPVLRAYLAARWGLPWDDDRIEDCVQDVFVQCFKDGGALQQVEQRQNEGFRSYLYGVARNVAGTTERRRRVRSGAESQPVTGMGLENVTADESRLSRVFDRSFAIMIACEARESLIRRSKGKPWVQVLELRFQDELPPREIAHRLEVDVKQVYELLRKAKQSYRNALMQVMATYHPECDEQDLEARCVELLTNL